MINLIIITGIWIIFTITGILTYGFKKTFAVNRWLFVIVGLGLFGVFTEWIMFFPAWGMRNVKFNPFWIWLDDSRFSSIRESGYSEDYEIHLKGKKETLRTATVGT